MNNADRQLAVVKLVRDGVISENTDPTLYAAVGREHRDISERLQDFGLKLNFRPDLGVAVARNMTDDEILERTPGVKSAASARIYKTSTLTHWSSIAYAILRSYYEDDCRAGVESRPGMRPEEFCLSGIKPYYKVGQQDDEAGLNDRTKASLENLAKYGWAELDETGGERFWRLTEQGVATFTATEVQEYMQIMDDSIAQHDQNEDARARQEDALAAQGDLL